MGLCNAEQPGLTDMAARAKCDAWRALGDMPRSLAAATYVAHVGLIWPEFKAALEAGVEPPIPDAASSDGMNNGSGGGNSGRTEANQSSVGGPVASRMCAETDDDDGDDVGFGRLVEAEDPEILERLLSDPEIGDALIHRRDEAGMTLMHWACDRGRADLVRVLLDHGADLDATDSGGLAPLHYAAMCSQVDCVSLMVESGADAELKDDNGDTAADLADGDPDVLAALSGTFKA